MDGIGNSLENIEEPVKDIIQNVRSKGDEAVIEYTKEIDYKDEPGIKFGFEDMEVNGDEWKEKAESLDPEMRGILEKAAVNIRTYAEKQNIYRDSEVDNDGIKIKDRFIPIEKAGIYVPGGNYPYPSVVLMCAIPARVAGVKEIIMVTPPKKLNPAVYAAAEIAGVDRIFRIGGAQAIAALAYGTETVPKVDKIVGPGNYYVQCAKWRVSKDVGIDMLSGPSEVVIIADEHQNSECVALCLLSQYEHADDAKAILITDSKKLEKEVNEKIKEKLAEYKPPFNGEIIYKPVENLDMAVERANQIAPEHLQLMCSDENIKKIEENIRNAGAVFIGRNTAVAVGDYWAGPSHAIPTGGAARFQEGLNVRSFLKMVSFIKCEKEIIKRIADPIAKFAEEEGLKYHAESVKKIADEE